MTSRGKRQSRHPGRRSEPDTEESQSTGEHIAGLYRRIYAVVRQVPDGRVVTYGQVAELAGMPGAARVVGTAMRLCEGGVPWHRVVGKRSNTTAKINILDPVGAGVQRSMLESEGVKVTEAGSISLVQFGWLPPDS